MKSNAQPGAHFQLVVFDGPLEVDWNIGPLSEARRPALVSLAIGGVVVDAFGVQSLFWAGGALGNAEATNLVIVKRRSWERNESGP